jgi:hypothetical protein
MGHSSCLKIIESDHNEYTEEERAKIEAMLKDTPQVA